VSAGGSRRVPWGVGQCSGPSWVQVPDWPGSQAFKREEHRGRFLLGPAGSSKSQGRCRRRQDAQQRVRSLLAQVHTMNSSNLLFLCMWIARLCLLYRTWSNGSPHFLPYSIELVFIFLIFLFFSLSLSSSFLVLCDWLRNGHLWVCSWQRLGNFSRTILGSTYSPIGVGGGGAVRYDCKVERVAKLTSHLHLEPKLRLRGALPQRHLYTCMAQF
jgi:hypothetical protein